MTWLVWRQHRNQACFAAAALAALAVLLLVTGLQMASQYQSALISCAAGQTCGSLASTLSLGTPVLVTVVTLTLAVPGLLGAFWGGPLVARELETATSQFAWMQSITRRRWFAVTVGWALLAAAAWGGRRLGSGHLVVQPAERSQASELRSRPVRHPGHSPRRLRTVRGCRGHRSRDAAAPHPAPARQRAVSV